MEDIIAFAAMNFSRIHEANKTARVGIDRCWRRE